MEWELHYFPFSSTCHLSWVLPSENSFILKYSGHNGGKKLSWQLWEIQEFTLCMSDSVNASLAWSGEGGSRCCVVNLHPFPLMSLWDLCDILLVFSLSVPLLLRTVFSKSGPSLFPWQRHKNMTLPVMALHIPTAHPVFMMTGHISLPLTCFLSPHSTRSSNLYIRLSKKQIAS